MLSRLSLCIAFAVWLGDSRWAVSQTQGEPPLPRSAYESRAAFIASEKDDKRAIQQPASEPKPTAEPELTQPPQANPTDDLAAQLDGAPATAPNAESEGHSTESRALPLPSPSRRVPEAPRNRDQSGRGRVVSLPSISTVLASLAIVLGLFLLLAWMLRRSLPRGSRLLPRDAVEVFGRAPLAKGQFMHLLRVGNKLLLVSVSNAGVEPLTEITDPIEVDRLAGLCKQGHPHSSTTAFRQVFQQFGNQNAAK